MIRKGIIVVLVCLSALSALRALSVHRRAWITHHTLFWRYSPSHLHHTYRVGDVAIRLKPEILPNYRYGTIDESFPLWGTDRRPSYHVLIVPYWLPVVVFAAYPLIAFMRGPLRRWRRRSKGSCQECGYNLTGNESGKCPECGTAI